MTTTIQKWGNSQGVRIPRYLLDAVSWSDHESVDIAVEEGRLIIKKATAAVKRRSINELFDDYDGGYAPEEIDWGSTVGKEIW